MNCEECLHYEECNEEKEGTNPCKYYIYKGEDE